MRFITGEYGRFLVKIKCDAGQYAVTIWDKQSVNPLGRLLANQTFRGDVEAAKAGAIEMLADLKAAQLDEIRRELRWRMEMAVKQVG